MSCMSGGGESGGDDDANFGDFGRMFIKGISRSDDNWQVIEVQPVTGLSPTISRKNYEGCRFHQSLECMLWISWGVDPVKIGKCSSPLKMLGIHQKWWEKHGNFTQKSHHDLVKLGAGEISSRCHRSTCAILFGSSRGDMGMEGLDGNTMRSVE